MNGRLVEIFNNINFNKANYSYFENASFSAKEVAEKSFYKITIDLEKFLPSKVYMELLSCFKSFLKKDVGLFINIKNVVYEQRILKDYLNNYIDNITTTPDEFEFIKKQSLSFKNNTLVIKYNSVFVEEKLNKIKVRLEKYLRAVGFNDLKLEYMYIEPDTFDFEKDAIDYEHLRKEFEEIKATQAKQEAKSSFTTFSRPNFSNKTFKPFELNEIPDNEVDIESEAFVFDVIAEGKSRKRFKINFSNFKASYTGHIWTNKNITAEAIEDTLNKWIKFRGTLSYNQFDKENSFELFDFSLSDRKEIEREDLEEEKRIELHAHTNMSAMDGIADVGELVKQAAKFGHEAIAITDHVAVQSFPGAQKAVESLAKKGIDFKVIYGIEMNVAPRALEIIKNGDNRPLKDASYVFFDLETSGLSCKFDSIIEFGAVKVINGQVVDRKDILINPGFEVSAFTTSLTHITNDMLKDKPKFEDVKKEIEDFIEDSILVAHNATFDIGFLSQSFGYQITNPIIDTLPLCRYLYQDEKKFTLGSMCRLNGIDYDEVSAHRGDYDAEVLKDLYDILLAKVLNDKLALTHQDLGKLQSPEVTRKMHPYHVNLLVKNMIGMKNLFKILSIANTDYFTSQALVPPHIIDQHKEGLLIGSSCARGEIFELASTKDENTLMEAMKWYDYIEIQPLDQYQVLVETDKVDSIDKVKKILNFIIETADKLKKPIVATGDCHYVNEKDHIAREVFISIPAIGGGFHPLYDGKGRIKHYPIQEFKTTRQMLDAFEWTGRAHEFVISNPKIINSFIEKCEPIKHDLYPPHIDNCENILRDACYTNAHKMYGENLPEIVVERLERELHAIIDHGYSIMYVLAMKSVLKSREDGFLVGSRGSVGSSFAATCAGITEVNPLKPHYRCLGCGYSDFEINDPTIRSGFDLPDKVCPCCGKILKGDGHDIPFETFMGFNGDKVPDIDLNFSALNQADAHDYIRKLFGYDHVFRAGTIATAASKTAFGYAKKYFESKGEEISNAEAARIAKMCEGVKRTTGQHPGGIIVVPNEYDVYDFTPVGHPADDMDSDWLTTHMDYHAIHDNILKLDMLGHVDPTAIRMLELLTHLDATTIPMNDREVLKMFNGDSIKENPGKLTAIGLPEFGTNVARKMLVETKPQYFADLTAIAGLAHGTDVYFGNEQELFKNGTCKIDDCIGCRDDIMIQLINYGIEKSDAFKIMEFVRKGNAKKDTAKWEEFKAKMVEKNVPEWYIETCYKIAYMFPKAHAVAYCLMSYRIAYYKLYYPLEYYATYFTTRSDAYDIEGMIAGIDTMQARYDEIQYKKNNNIKLTKKEEDLDTFYEVVIEMYQRGICFENISLEKSEAFDFVCDFENKALIPPFKVLDGVGQTAAISVVEARKSGSFVSKEDLIKRTKLNGTNIKLLEKLKILDKLSDTDQLTIFNI